MLTTDQAADRLDISRRRVLALIASGRIPAKKFGSAWMIEADSLAKVATRTPGRPAAKAKPRKPGPKAKGTK